MTGSVGIRPSDRPSGRLFVLLVLAVLAGVLGMHALGPGGTSAAKPQPAMQMDHGGAAAQAPGAYASAAQAQAQQPGAQAPAKPQPPGTDHAPAAQAPVTGHTPAEPTAVAQAAGDACSHTEGGSGHLAHADRTCAAAGTASAYAPPAPAADALPGVPDAARVPTARPAATAPDRAPPDLAELQLLRI